MNDFKKLRIENNLTQQEVADKANISLRQLVRIEKKQSFPTLETRILLYKALNISESEIIEYIINNYIKENKNGKHI